MTRIIVCVAVLLGLSACEYGSQARVAVAPTKRSPRSTSEIR